MRRSLIAALAGLTLLSPAGARAQQPQAPAPCATAKHHAFDFWIGTWDVYNATGVLAGRNVIRAVHGGCALEEAWSGAAGVTGGSLNAWDAGTGVWRQSWVDSSGLVLELEGGLEGDDMVMSGHVANSDGSRSLHRIRWTPRADGTVRQHWEASADDGQTWSTLFDGTYRRP